MPPGHPVPEHRPPVDPRTTGAVLLALVAISSSAPLIAFATAPALAIPFWRNALAVAVLGPFSLARRRVEFWSVARGPRRREGLFCVLAGIALAAHFATWMPSVQLTSVAAATALVATQPVWQGLIAIAQGQRLRTVTWAGIGVAVLGAALATGDLERAKQPTLSRHLFGRAYNRLKAEDLLIEPGRPLHVFDI